MPLLLGHKYITYYFTLPHPTSIVPVLHVVPHATS
jgi:hypothetical protein